MAYGSVQIYSSGSDSMDYDNDGSDDEDMDIYIGTDNNSNTQIGCLVVMESFSNE